jgi:glutamine amidotransferase
MIANVNVDFKFSLSNFSQFAKHNPDGYGIGWYEKGKPKVMKEPISALNSENFIKISHQATSTIFICHVRKSTKGKPKIENCHPFNYEQWLFAHNGSIYNSENLKELLKDKYKTEIKGETDSEVFFYWILQNIEEAQNDIDGIAHAIKYICDNLKFSGLNFILSNGEKLYAFRYSSTNTNYYSLFWLKRDPEISIFQTGILESKEFGVLIESKKLNHEKAIIVCSERLTQVENWEPIKLGALLIVSKDLNIQEILII